MSTLMIGLFRCIKKISTVLVACVVLSSCYMPMHFDAEIEVTRGGYYSMIFNGYIVKVPLYDDIRQKKIKSVDIRTKAESFRKSMANDASMTSVKYVQQGVYQVHWERKGDILKSKFVTFMQRNENMLSLRYVKTDGTIRMAGATPSSDQRKRLSEIGLDSQGQLRLISDANVTEHNANRVTAFPTRGPNFSMYIWDIDNIFTPSPYLTINLY